MPRFNDSCLWTGGYVSVFYPTNNPWPSEYTSTLISSYGGNLGITMGTFDPNNLPTSSGSTEPTTVETTAETTVETTQETTEAATTETTEPDAEEKKKESKGWIGIAMVAGVLTMLLAGAMIVRGIGRRNQF